MRARLLIATVSFSALLPLLLGGCGSGQPATRPPRAAADTAAMLRVGDDMLRAGDPQAAIGFYEQATQADPRDPAPLEHLGRARLALGSPRAAEASFRAAQTLAPNDAEAQRGLAASLLAQGRADAALPILQDLSHGSADPSLLRDYGAALDLSGRPVDAQATYRRALQLAPARADLHGNLALSLALVGAGPAALDEVQAALAAPNVDSAQQANAVMILALLGREDEARQRGATALGATATEELIERAAHARAASGPAEKAAALGLVTAGSTPNPATVLPAAPAALPSQSVPTLLSPAHPNPG